MSACSVSRNSGLFLTLALPISEQMRGVAGPAGGGAGVSPVTGGSEILATRSRSPDQRSYHCQDRQADAGSKSQRISRQPTVVRKARRLAQTGSRSLASLGMKINGPVHKYFQQTAKNLASGGRLVRVEVSSKSEDKPFIKSMPKRG